MGRIRRYRTALSRHHRSQGFGIHSPFAFRFVLDVLRERLPYYAYDDIAQLRAAVVHAVSHHWRHPRIISAKNAKMLFRLVNFFNPPCILQVGTSYGVSTACMMAVDRSSRLWLYEPHLDRYPVVGRVLEPLLQRVDCYDDPAVAVADYRRAVDAAGAQPFVLVNDLPCAEADYDLALGCVQWTIDCGGVLVMRNLSREPLMKRLWLDAQAYAQRGQTFTNEKIAIIVANPKLQREDFFLWF